MFLLSGNIIHINFVYRITHSHFKSFALYNMSLLNAHHSQKKKKQCTEKKYVNRIQFTYTLYHQNHSRNSSVCLFLNIWKYQQNVKLNEDVIAWIWFGGKIPSNKSRLRSQHNDNFDEYFIHKRIGEILCNIIFGENSVGTYFGSFTL